ncbi:hypothetical protein [Streptomyces tateyamensis]|nr:hypothetical protein [Streptomyces tateyamensis]
MKRFVAKRMGTTTEVADGSHVVMLPRPDVVLTAIRAAAKAVQEA